MNKPGSVTDNGDVNRGVTERRRKGHFNHRTIFSELHGKLLAKRFIVAIIISNEQLFATHKDLW
jgi:hypothetical protein